METATLFTCGFANHIPTGALLLVFRSTPDFPVVLKQRRVITSYRKFVEEHVKIGIEVFSSIIHNSFHY